jgi:hypothetical protein
VFVLLAKKKENSYKTVALVQAIGNGTQISWMPLEKNLEVIQV